MTRSIVLIANPAAKNADNQSMEYRSIIDYLKKHHLQVHFFETKTLTELRSTLQTCLQDGCIEYIALGGDGTFHYSINELINLYADIEDFSIGVIPLGTGNDWLKNFNYSCQEDILDAIIQGNTKKVDLGRIELKDSSPRYFMNIAGIGFNGAVIQNIDRFKKIGKWAYFASILYSFKNYKSHRIKLKIDGIEYDENTFILTIGIGKYAGGDMLLCPRAELDDGLFEVHLIRGITKFKLIQNILRLKDGTYLRHLDCIILKAKSIEILENEFLSGEADGEFLGYEMKSFDISDKSMNIYH